MKLRTWHVELAVVCATLQIVAACSGGGAREFLGALAVTITFAHAQVADRLAEREAARPVASVDCHRWNTRYLVSKEALWLVYFVSLSAWSALAGVGLFLLYPVWRRHWRRTHPLFLETIMRRAWGTTVIVREPQSHRALQVEHVTSSYAVSRETQS